MTILADETMTKPMRLWICVGISCAMLGCGGSSGESKPAAGAPGVDTPDRGGVIEMVQDVREDKGRRPADVLDDPGALADVAKAIEHGTKPEEATKGVRERLAASGTPGVEATCCFWIAIGTT